MTVRTEYIYFDEDENGKPYPACSARRPVKYEDQTPCVTVEGNDDLIESLLDAIFGER